MSDYNNTITRDNFITTMNDSVHEIMRYDDCYNNDCGATAEQRRLRVRRRRGLMCSLQPILSQSLAVTHDPRDPSKNGDPFDP